MASRYGKIITGPAMLRLYLPIICIYWLFIAQLPRHSVQFSL
jgi:hypothetical protein